MVVIAGRDHGHNYLDETAEVFRNDLMALFVPMSICREDSEPNDCTGPNGDWRVKVRGCLLNPERLNAVLPVPSGVEGARPALP